MDFSTESLIVTNVSLCFLCLDSLFPRSNIKSSNEENSTNLFLSVNSISRAIEELEYLVGNFVAIISIKLE